MTTTHDSGEPNGLLAIFAHPDDESFGAGGVMALAAHAGRPVWVVCATNGDQGGRPGEDVEDHSMDPEIRLQELRCACAAIGAADPIFLGYRDSGMEGWGAPEGALSRADPEEVVERLVAEIRRLRPAVVVTFDPGGIYGHPDHVAISRFATEAYQRVADDAKHPMALYHQALPRSRVEAMQRLMEQAATADGQEVPQPSPDDLRQQEAFVRLSRPDTDITTHVDVRPVLDRKIAALGCHESQMRGRSYDEERALTEQTFGWETFVRVDPPAAPGTREEDLFAIV